MRGSIACSMINCLDDIRPAAQAVHSRLEGFRPEWCLVLGSGFGAIVEQLTDFIVIDYTELPGFPPTRVAGHAGHLYAGRLFDCPVLVWSGRYHVYEGYSAWQVTAPVRVAAELDSARILLTNAVGGINDGMQPGDFMQVTDHLNLTGQNPLIGRPDVGFPDLHELYHAPSLSPAEAALRRGGANLWRGTLAWMSGPSYETPAEIRMLERLGADAVSMSTVPEAIVGRYLGLQVSALSFVANRAAGKSPQPLTHEDVLAAANSAGDNAVTLIRQLLTASL